MKQAVFIEMNEKFISISSWLMCGMYMRNPDKDSLYLAPDISNNDLGLGIRDQLQASKEISPEEFSEIFESGRAQKIGELEEDNDMKKYGYKTKKDLYKNASFLSIDADDDKLTISPHHQKKLNQYTTVFDNNGERVEFIYSINIGDDELGAALRKAKEFCTSNYRK